MIELSDFINFVGGQHFLLAVKIAALVVRFSLFILLTVQTLRSKQIPTMAYLLFGVFSGSLLASSTSVLKIIDIDRPLFIAFSRIAWACVIIQYQSLALFIENLTKKNFSLSWYRKPFLLISAIVCGYFFYIGFFKYPEFDNKAYASYFLFSSLYAFQLIIPSAIFAIRRIRTKELPRIIKRQLAIVIPYVICPWLFFDLLQLYMLFNKNTFSLFTINTISSLSTILLTYALYYCTRKVVEIRFLNITDHVASIKKNTFIDSFKVVLEQLGHVTTASELNHITQTFFNDAFNVPIGKTHLYLRSLKSNSAHDVTSYEMSFIESTVETFLATHKNNSCSMIQQSKILINDEIVFSNFYERNEHMQEIVTFLETINADIFLPLFAQGSMIGYIIVERNARQHQFYTNVERDEMLVLTNYLSNVINLIHNKNFESLIQQEKELKEELFNKSQEINQYKESLRSFLRTAKQKEIGIIFYKNRRFTFGNQIAQELVAINLNTQEGHPLTKTCKQIVRTVKEYKTPQTSFAKDINNNKIIFSGVPSVEHNSVIITVYYPEISDIVKKQVDLLQDPTKWDYLLYLETTKSGKLINQLIPGTGETLLNFKINLLKAALSTKATLLEMNEEDLIPMVELLHHISLRKQLHILSLTRHTDQNATAISLFGINPIFQHSETKQPLLKTLNETGTLFIKNVEELSLETQNYLAEFIKYGYYRIFKSDTKVPSNVRIICSTNADLLSMAHDKTFSSELLNELKKASLSMPSLTTLPQQELCDLAEGFTEQTLQHNEFKSLLELTENEKYNIARKRPVSLSALKIKIQQLVSKKSQKNHIIDEKTITPAYTTTDPELLEAAQLGKHALRDRRIMTTLWNKFQSQSKIATFLGVNRSSINRRCKEYDLQ